MRCADVDDSTRMSLTNRLALYVGIVALTISAAACASNAEPRSPLPTLSGAQPSDLMVPSLTVNGEQIDLDEASRPYTSECDSRDRAVSSYQWSSEDHLTSVESRFTRREAYFVLDYLRVASQGQTVIDYALRPGGPFELSTSDYRDGTYLVTGALNRHQKGEQVVRLRFLCHTHP
jgi:hypothetical protein